MKVFFGLLFLAIIALQSVVAVPGTLGAQLAVNATAVDYTFVPIGLGVNALTLTVSSASAGVGSNVVLNTFTSYPTGSIPVSVNASLNVNIVNNGLPAGYVAFTSSNTLVSALGAGLIVNMSADIDGRADARLVLNPLVVSQFNASLVAAFSPLYFDASTQSYIELPRSQYTVDQNAGISITTTRSVMLVLAARSTIATVINLSNSAVTYANIVANATASFAFTEGTRTAFTITNLTAAAGTFAVSAYNNATIAAGNVLVSSIYRLNHSAGARAQVSAQFQYQTSQSSVSLNAALVANSAWYVYENNAWVRQSSSVSNGVVIYNTNHFSDWSVQSSGNSSTPTNAPTTGNNTGAAARAQSIFSTLLKALF